MLAIRRTQHGIKSSGYTLRAEAGPQRRSRWHSASWRRNAQAKQRINQSDVVETAKRTLFQLDDPVLTWRQHDIRRQREHVVNFEPRQFRQPGPRVHALVQFKNLQAFVRDVPQAPAGLTGWVLPRDRAVRPTGHEEDILTGNRSAAQETLQPSNLGYPVAVEIHDARIAAVQDNGIHRSI